MSDPADGPIITTPDYTGPDRREHEMERELTARIRAACDARFLALESWQGRQNGSLQQMQADISSGFSRVEGRVDKLIIATVSIGGGVIAALLIEVLLR